MSGLFQALTSDVTLARIHKRLHQGTSPTTVINELLHQTRSQVLSENAGYPCGRNTTGNIRRRP